MKVSYAVAFTKVHGYLYKVCKFVLDNWLSLCDVRVYEKGCITKNRNCVEMVKANIQG